MLKHGVHFGHKKSRWNPKMKPFTFGVKNNIHIIDLDKTLKCLEEALEYLRGVVKNGGKVLLVGTKPQAKRLIEEAGKASGMPYVSSRWLGGTFSNFSEIKKRIKYLNEQESKLAAGEFEKYTKYEKGQIKKEIDKMNEKIGGIKKMESLPQSVFVADIKEDALAVKEARGARIPVLAIVDTNTDPSGVDFPIPGNDDALSSIRYIVNIIVKEIKEAKPVAIPAAKKENAKE
ncbi:MAG: 30S ribosomal protein S2 [Candidatus Moranbacteria bacterium RBG_13_45_13]|nr:MAG: 30S ribosomal protein S2 [Candidatus Moranbacteria bacterium RBG_13_45_13]